MRLTTSSPSRVEYHEVWEPTPPGTVWATPGLLRDCFLGSAGGSAVSRNSFVPLQFLSVKMNVVL